MFTFRLRNSHRFPVPCVNCERTVAAKTLHECEAFTDDKALVSEESLVLGFCHCGGFFRGSDHCQCCGCEEHEATCDHECRSLDDEDVHPFNRCMTDHDERGRII